jgi:hypothetical protein
MIMELIAESFIAVTGAEVRHRLSLVRINQSSAHIATKHSTASMRRCGTNVIITRNWAGQCAAKRNKVGQGAAGCGGARSGWARQGKAGHGEAWLGAAKLGRAR